ncbi:MAG: manganese efflux pump MntP family protein [Candidatus Eremiobacteraeota bacterium]|nr:manganese efflux pump MntP family protein [Candidatus Eremiobacteraeota bacterium]
MNSAIKLFVIALSLALDVFAVSIGVGVRGVPGNVKLRIGTAFAFAEIAMNCIGAWLGAVAGRMIGDAAGYIGFVALLGLGIYMIYESRNDNEDRLPLDMSKGWGLMLASLAISLDSLGIGFSILYIGVPLVLALATIGLVSVGATVAGLWLGKRLGVGIEENAELLGGVLLALTGAAFIVLKALHVG